MTLLEYIHTVKTKEASRLLTETELSLDEIATCLGFSNEYYFNAFFKDGGAYKKYVTAEDENKTSRMRAEHSTQDNYGVIVRVKRAELRQRLIDDNILKP